MCIYYDYNYVQLKSKHHHTLGVFLQNRSKVYQTVSVCKWAAIWQNQQMCVHLAKTQISLDIRPVWSESLLSAWRKLGSLATHKRTAKTLIRLGGCPGWSESSLSAHSFCCFCHVMAQIILVLKLLNIILAKSPSSESSQKPASSLN